MKRLLGMVACSLIVAACQRPVAAPAPPTVEDLVDTTVALVRLDTGNLRPFCSGVWVGPTTIVTAAHCVKDEPEIAYVQRTDVYAPASVTHRTTLTMRRANVVRVDEPNDLALLDAPEAPSHHWAPVSTTIEQGMSVRTVGHPMGLDWSYSTGAVAAIRKTSEDGPVWVQSTAPISPGNSGGGLFDARGSLVGICSRTSGARYAQNLNLFVHPQYIAALIK